MCLFVLSTITAFAQSGRGGISGTVTDASGAIVAKATVVAVDTAKGTRLSTASTGAGVYSFISVASGTYDITVSRDGFDTSVQKNRLVVVHPRQKHEEGRILRNLMDTVPAVPSLYDRLPLCGAVNIGVDGKQHAAEDSIPEIQTLCGQTVLVYDSKKIDQSFCPRDAVRLATRAYRWLFEDDRDHRAGRRPPLPPDDILRALPKSLGIGLPQRRPGPGGAPQL